MVGHSMTRAPRSSKRVRNSADCEAARVIRTVLPFSSILGDLRKDFPGSHGKQFFAEFQSQLESAIGEATQLMSDDALAVQARNQSFNGEVAAGQVCPSRNWDLAAAAERAQQATFRGHCDTRGGIIQHPKQIPRGLIARAADDA